jgi:demethylmenaquinone methyltransferase / 2-methoxy-6-polyprenyl-1,4-benzoquinol methylase
MELSEKSKKIQEMFDKISIKYDFLNRILSFSQDVKWRKVLVKNLPVAEDFKNSQALTLVDVACGTGDVMFATAKNRPDYKIINGFDISAGMISAGMIRKELKPYLKENSGSISFAQASAENLPLANNSAQAVSISFGLRNVDNRNAALKEFFRILTPSGKVLILEFFKSNSTLFSKIFDFYFKKILPKIGGFFSDKSAYAYLPQSVSSMPSASIFKKQLEETGFTHVKEICWLAGTTRLFIATKPNSD